jgi:hypothetical protein
MGPTETQIWRTLPGARCATELSQPLRHGNEAEACDVSIVPSLVIFVTAQLISATSLSKKKKISNLTITYSK